jgi:hypothetical protein
MISLLQRKFEHLANNALDKYIESQGADRYFHRFWQLKIAVSLLEEGQVEVLSYLTYNCVKRGIVNLGMFPETRSNVATSKYIHNQLEKAGLINGSN